MRKANAHAALPDEVADRMERLSALLGRKWDIVLELQPPYRRTPEHAGNAGRRWVATVNNHYELARGRSPAAALQAMEDYLLYDGGMERLRAYLEGGR